MTEEKSYRWNILLVAYLASLTFAVTLQSVPPILSLLIQEFRLTHAEAGLTMSLFALPMVFLSIPAGIAADRYGFRLVGLATFILTIVGTLVVAFRPSFPLLLVGRALAGIGAFTLFIIAPKFLSESFLGKELATAMGIWNTGFPLATVLSLLTMGSVGQALGWRAPILISAGVAGVSLAVFMLLARPAPLTGGGSGPPSPGLAAFLRAGVPIWLVGLAWLLYTGSNLSYVAFAPDYFQSSGYSVATAGLLSSGIFWGSLILSPSVGLLLDRGMGKEVAIGAGGVIFALGLVAIPANLSLIAAPLLMLTVANSLIVVGVFTLPTDLLAPRLLGLGYGILSTCLNAGVVLGPLVAGLARDLSGTYTASFWALAVMALLVSATMVPLAASRKAALPPATGG